MSYQGFILSGTQVIRDNASRLIFQGRLSDGLRFHWSVTRPGIVFFINRDEDCTSPGASRKNVELRNLRGELVDALYFRNTPELNRARITYESRNIFTYEADVNLVARFLMERFIHGSVALKNEPDSVKNGILYFVDPQVKPTDFTPVLKLLSIDIECSLGLDLYSIALYGKGLEVVLMVDPNHESGEDTNGYRSFRGEQELLEAFFYLIREYDPDAFIGWNLVGFDLQWLSRKCKDLGIAFDIGTDGPAEMLEPGKISNQWIARIPGRAALDGINMARIAYIRTEDYALSTVASKVLGRKKLIEKTGSDRAGEITRLFNHDKEGLARYNIEDAKLVYDIFERLDFAQLAVRRSQLTGLALDRVGGSAAALDFLYLPRLHRRGYVADTHPLPPARGETAPGGLVLESEPGLYRNVAVLDFKSLYPSIIRTFRVDPLAANAVMFDLEEKSKSKNPLVSNTIVKGPAGLEFAEHFAILPEIIQELWSERDKAKRAKDDALSHAVKIIMNSFYGVLGSPGCRFYDPRLAGTITRIGHWILTFSRAFIEEEGYQVIYGDTDSLFVHLGDGEQNTVNQTGSRLASSLNRHLNEELKQRYNLESYLDIEFEKVFIRFLMPTVRGKDTGSKKRYAGLQLNADGEPELFFAGLESSRRDWTALAKEFQADLLMLLFQKDGSPELQDELCALTRNRYRQLHNGELDDKLVYHKGISKRLEDYTKNVPPHVRAARMLDRLEGRIVRYVMTQDGPEPVQKRSGTSLDYDHYSEKQLAPIADMVLRLFDTDYHTVTRDREQLNLFA